MEILQTCIHPGKKSARYGSVVRTVPVPDPKIEATDNATDSKTDGTDYFIPVVHIRDGCINPGLIVHQQFVIRGNQ